MFVVAGLKLQLSLYTVSCITAWKVVDNTNKRLIRSLLCLFLCLRRCYCYICKQCIPAESLLWSPSNRFSFSLLTVLSIYLSHTSYTLFLSLWPLLPLSLHVSLPLFFLNFSLSFPFLLLIQYWRFSFLWKRFYEFQFISHFNSLHSNRMQSRVVILKFNFKIVLTENIAGTYLFIFVNYSHPFGINLFIRSTDNHEYHHCCHHRRCP